MRIKFTPIILLFLIPKEANAIEVRFNAFGDISAAAETGDYAEEEERDLFEEHGTDPDPVSTNRGLQISGTDFVLTADLEDDLIYQAEINLQVCRGCPDEIEVDFERMYLDYTIHDMFNVQAGLFFTPIGYINRNLYARGWLMNSIQVRDIVEEELELVPTHTVGIMAHGDFDLGSDNYIMYALSVGNGRGTTVTGATYARDQVPANIVTALLEFRSERFKNFRIGISGWTDQITTTMVGREYGDGPVQQNGSDVQLKLRETGYNPYIAFDSSLFGLLVECHHATLTDLNEDGKTLKDNGWDSDTYELTAITAELALNFGKLHPYVRYDQTDLPDENGGPYYGIREDESGVAHKYIPEFEATMVGVAYDLYSFNRLKLEYISHMSGPRKDAVVVQSAFAF